jgi:A/G-specific adenine glycosylase
MDLGAIVCRVARPMCLLCPLLAECQAAPLVGTWRERRLRGMRSSRQSRGRRSRSSARVLRSEGLRESPAPLRLRSGQAFETSPRFYRGRLVDELRRLGSGERVRLLDLGPRLKHDFSIADWPWLEDLARRLAADGLVDVLGDAGAQPTELQVGLPE